MYVDIVISNIFNLNKHFFFFFFFSLVSGQDASGLWDGCIYVRDGYGAFHQPKFECGCCDMLVFRVCGVRQNLYVYSLYRNPDLDDRIFYCLLASMAAMQGEDVRASFLFVGDLNGHHQEWLGSRTTIRHGVTAFDFAQSLVAISWLSAQPMLVVEHLTS